VGRVQHDPAAALGLPTCPNTRKAPADPIDRGFLTSSRPAHRPPTRGCVTLSSLVRWLGRGATRLTSQAVALVLKRHAARAGLDPDEVPVTRCGPVLRPRPLLPESPSASSPSRRATRARRCFAATSGRTPCSVRTPPARLDCSETLSLDADGACGPYRMLLATRTR
jgi:hypothetical protein